MRKEEEGWENFNEEQLNGRASKEIKEEFGKSRWENK